MTARDMVDQYLPGGSDSVAGKAVHQFLASFLGLDLADLSGLAVVDNYVGHTPGADERYHVRGGNDQIVHAPRRHPARNGDHAWMPRYAACTDAATAGSSCGSTTRRSRWSPTTSCSRLPFTTLREVDLDGAGLSRRKRRCIAELGMGTNAKVILQFAAVRRSTATGAATWRSSGPYFDVWESSAGQPGGAGLLTTYFGGRSGASGLPGRLAARPRSASASSTT